MCYKIVFSDIDGTLLNKNRELSERTIRVIQEIKNKIPVVLISARMPAAMHHLQKELGIEDQPIICYNGGYVLADEKVLSSTTISLEILKELAAYNQKNLHLSLYNANQWHVPAKDQWADKEARNTKVSPKTTPIETVLEAWTPEQLGAHKIMAMGDEDKVDELENFLTDNFKEQLRFYRSKTTYLEISHRHISKLTAIDYLLDNQFGIDRSQAIAFGDNYNDVEMIKSIGMGIAVANARDEVKAVANKITDTNINDGVAKILEQIFDL